MPKNKGKGGKKFKKSKDGTAGETKRELIFKEENEDYARVVKMLGNCNVQVKPSDGGDLIIAHIRGTMVKRKVWVSVGDLVLISLRDYQDDKADVVHLYKPDEVSRLKAYGELKEDSGSGGKIGGSEETDAIMEFDEDAQVEFDIDIDDI